MWIHGQRGGLHRPGRTDSRPTRWIHGQRGVMHGQRGEFTVNEVNSPPRGDGFTRVSDPPDRSVVLRHYQEGSSLKPLTYFLTN
eukprot:3426496-Pyramimonas_sp.AAC.2